MRNIAIIPARGGSKRIPHKNIIDFSGEPAIVRVIQTAHASGIFSEVIVSTDDKLIAEISRSSNAKAIMRPKKLSDDYTPILPVIQHVLEKEELVKLYMFDFSNCRIFEN